MQKEIQQLFLRTDNMMKKQIDDNTAMKDFVNREIGDLNEEILTMFENVYTSSRNKDVDYQELNKRMKILENQFLNLHDTYAKSILEPVKPIKKSFDWRKWVTKKLDR